MNEKAKFVSAGTVAVVAAAVAGICHFEGHRGWACVAVAVAVLTAIFAVFAVRRHLAGDRQWVIPSLLQSHFAPVSLADLRISQRSFPLHIRVDVQRTLERLFEDLEVVRLTGVRKESAFFGVDFSDLTTEDSTPAVATAPQYEDVDVGDQRPIRCLKNGLWLLKRGQLPCALLMTQVADPCGPGSLRMEWATLDDAEGAAATEEIFRRLEQTLADASCYRGKVLSFEVQTSYRGESSGITVHRLRTVEREQVILPPRTLELLDRNVLKFVRQRPELRKFRQATKKGLLFYGPPGTGKTHTIHYLAKALPDHTAFLISAEQVRFLSHYMTLARLLQPALVVIEDVDLIARDREDMRHPWEETLLNKLLNEMDGLRDDADILFILTTNRPESLEVALASRPGRIDQAIEFPLPDDAGRRKLVALYSPGVTLSEELAQIIAARTDGVSAAFIRELMRRSIQFHLENDGTGQLMKQDVESALDEMLFAGGSLNVKLLGGVGPEESTSNLAPVR
jgi:cell division protease FtsH